MVTPVVHLDYHGSRDFTLKPFKYYTDQLDVVGTERLIFETFSHIRTIIQLVNIAGQTSTVSIYATLEPDNPAHDTATELRDNWHKLLDEVQLAVGSDMVHTVTDPYSHILVVLTSTDSDVIMRVRQQVES